MEKLEILIFFIVSVCGASEVRLYQNNDIKCVYASCDQENVLRIACSALWLHDICESIRNITAEYIALSAKVNDTQLTHHDFTGCESLQELWLTNNNLIHLERDALSNMTELLLLDLSHNKLDIYRNVSVYELYLPLSLRTLKLNGNIGANVRSFGHLKYPLFAQANELRTLFIDGLPYRDFDVFKDKANSLEDLTMTSMSGYCNIPYIKRTTFRQACESLKVLNISDCNITKFEFGALQDFKQLEVLDMSYNRELGLVALENIAYGLQFTKIKVFNYSYVHKPFGKSLTVRKSDLCYLYNTSIEEFTLEGNRIDLFESNSFILLPSVKTFRIGSNKLTIGMYIFQLGCILNLTDFHSGNQDTYGLIKHNELLLHIDEYVSKQNNDCPENFTSDCPYMYDEYLQKITQGNEYCSFYNGVTLQLPKTMHIKNIFAPKCGKFVTALILITNLDIDKIEKLDLSRNRIYKIPPLSITAPNLKYLDLSENRCGSLDINTGNSAPSLEQLYLQNNLLGLTLQDHQFESFHNLKVLNLSDNLIHDLPPNVFLNMKNLEVLDLSFNKIQKWTANVDSLLSLIHLNLSGNVIESLPSLLLHHLDNKGRFSIDLRNNTIQLSCNNKDFLYWIVKHKNNMIGYRDYQFNDNGQRLTAEEFEHKVFSLNSSCQSYIGFIVFPSVFILLFFIVVFAGIIHKHRWQIRYFVYMTKRKYFSYDNVPEEDTVQIFKYEAFISYAEDNSDFVTEQLVPKLENYGLSLCVHQRDFVPGKPIIDNILNAVQSSRITLATLSPEFIKSRWCMYEFQMARMESIYTRDDKGSLLIVMKDNIPIEDMPLEMINWIKYDSYLEYTEEAAGEQLFWERLKKTLNIRLF